MTLAGKSLFVTGGNSGIGLATALRFAREGADIAILSRRSDLNEQAKAQVEALGVKCLTIAGDVTRETDVKAAIDATVAAFGGIDFAFNCAGLNQSVTPLEAVTLEEFSAQMDVNARGTFLSMKYQIPVMRARGGGAFGNLCGLRLGWRPISIAPGSQRASGFHKLPLSQCQHLGPGHPCIDHPARDPED